MGKTEAPSDFLCTKGLKRAPGTEPPLEAYDAQIHHKEGRWILQTPAGDTERDLACFCVV